MADEEDTGIEVGTTSLESGGVEIQIRLERAIDVRFGAGRYTFERFDDLASWLKNTIGENSDEFGGEDLEREPGTNRVGGEPGQGDDDA